MSPIWKKKCYQHFHHCPERGNADSKLDHMMKMKHSVFDFENDVYLCLCYIPPSNSSRQGIIESNTFDDIFQNI